MNFLVLIGALALTYYRPLASVDWLQKIYTPYANLLERNFNGGKNRHGVLAWIMGVLLPTVIIAISYFVLLQIQAILGLFFGIVVLYLTIRFSQFSTQADAIVLALRDRNIDLARKLLTLWDGHETEHYTHAQVAKVSIETMLKRTHQGLFAPIIWFALLGPAGAVLYRLTHLSSLTWSTLEDPLFSRFATRFFGWMDWLPARITAGSFAIVGDFEDAVYCWRTQALHWPDKSLGIIFASGGGALGVKLGEALMFKGVLQYRPEIGMGDEADADYLQSAVGMVWRVLVLMVSLLLLLNFAHWLGS